ncbi:hypothetical protein KR093_002436 [Drosophila rubida]|uniref:LEM domain-containing protein n=1 Tax=Drosophila rubida TaxID=30044 RepID=A0AAD4JYC3_9MUSC|nr:hypothetical protein KR093_002436 [Drosophila rubida]
MADSDNLDSLSNNELRAQMIAQGLPNIPVTDSSRKVLVKRLRASLGGNALPAASPKKTSNRRETLQPAAAAAADKPDGTTASKARRTIASTLNETKEVERRRPAVIKPEAVVAQPARAPPEAAAAPKAAPIQSRRASNTERREVNIERVIKKPDIAAEKPTQPRRRSPEDPLDNSLIILESDEEEDEELAQAVQNAEDLYKHKQKDAAPSKLPTKLPIQEPQRRQQIYESQPRELPKAREVPRPREMTTQPLARSQATNYSQAPSFSQAAGFNQPPSRSLAPVSQARAAVVSSSSSSSSYTRYSSYVSAPSTTYTTSSSSLYSGAAAAGTSGYPRTYANEFSDDTAEDDDDQAAGKAARFESDFARKLASLRAERIGDRSSPYTRRTVAGASGSGFEPVARRSLRPENVSLSAQFRQLCRSIDQRYRVKSIFILVVFVLLFAAYKFYY